MTDDALKQRILILAPRGRDGRAMAEVLARANLATHVCGDLSALLKELDRGAGSVCLAEEALAIGGYDSLKTWVTRQPPWSDMPFVILTSRAEDTSIGIWRETLTTSLRNVALLERPVQAITLTSALRVAVKSRNRQHEVQNYMALQSEVAQRLERLVTERTSALEATNQELKRQIAERERVEEQLRHAQKMEAIGQLTGGLAHDFNNMLAIVVGALNMLTRRLKTGDPSIMKYIDAAMEGTRRAAQLTKRLLAFSRRQSLSPKAVDPNKLVLGMSELLRGTLGRDIVLEAVTDSGIWEVFVDPGQLENAIVNIAFNARDAMPNGGKLVIETQNVYLDDRDAAAHLGAPPGQYLLISMTDTGAGISPAIVEKIFDPFFTTKEVGQGTGLGLSQVYGFITQSGGYIKVHTEMEKGTSIKIYLPRYFPQKSVDEHTDSKAALLSEGHQELILVVDDEEAVRNLTADALTELGYRVLEAPESKTALKLIEQDPSIDMLLTDVIMPEVSGRMLADQAKEARPELKVLYMTGFTRNAVGHNGVIDADVNLISKPFTLEELAEKVRVVLRG